jgi:hypothetical protein
MADMITTAETDFNVRWSAWIARGRAHERRVRRNLVVSAGLLSIVAIVVYMLVR